GALGLALAHGGGHPLRPVPSRRGGAWWHLPPLTGAPTLGGGLDRLRSHGVPPRVPLKPCPPDLLAKRAACPAEPIRGTDHLPCHHGPQWGVSVSALLSTWILLSCGRGRHPQTPIPRRGEAGVHPFGHETPLLVRQQAADRPRALPCQDHAAPGRHPCSRAA